MALLILFLETIFYFSAKMKFQVILLGGKKVQFDIPGSTKVREFKRIVSQNNQLPGEGYLYFIARKLTDDNLTLQDYGIEEGSTVHLMQRDLGGDD